MGFRVWGSEFGVWGTPQQQLVNPPRPPLPPPLPPARVVWMKWMVGVVRSGGGVEGSHARSERGAHARRVLLPERCEVPVGEGVGEEGGGVGFHEYRVEKRALFRLFRKVDVRLPGKGNSNSHGAST